MLSEDDVRNPDQAAPGLDAESDADRDPDTLETPEEQREWEALIENPESVDMTRAQVIEIRRRLRELRRHPERTIPWEVVSAELDEMLDEITR